ncbi:MAG TPA: hypothetical protein VIO38_03155, partial [Rariglobus sp.]
ATVGRRWENGVISESDLAVPLIASGVDALVDHALTYQLPHAVTKAAAADARGKEIRLSGRVHDLCERVGSAALRAGGTDLVHRVARCIGEFDPRYHCDVRDAVAIDCVDALGLVLGLGSTPAWAKSSVWEHACRADAVDIVRRFLVDAAAAEGLTGCHIAQALLKRHHGRHDRGPCVVVGALAAAAYGGTRVLDVLDEWGALDNVRELIEHACIGGSIEGLAWCIAAQRRRGSTEIRPLLWARKAVALPRRDSRDEPRVDWNCRRAVRLVAWLRDPAGGRFGALLDEPDSVQSILHAAIRRGGIRASGRCEAALLSLFAPALAAAAASERCDPDGKCHARDIVLHAAERLGVLVCERRKMRVAERVVLTLEHLERCFCAHGLTLVGAIDLWATVSDFVGEFDTLHDLAGTMAYALARVGGRSAGEAVREAWTACRSSMGWYDDDVWWTHEASVAAWRRWWHPRPVSVARATDLYDRGRTRCRGPEEGPVLGDPRALDVVRLLADRGLLGP